MVGRSVRVLAGVLVFLLLAVTGGMALPGGGSTPALAAASTPAPTTAPGVGALPSAPAVDAVTGVEKGRLGGLDRMATSVEISKAAFPDGADVVYLARRDVLADALAAGMLTDGPVLLVPSCRNVPAVVAGEIARVDPDRVVALGGEQSVCQEVLELAATGRSWDRIAGPNRYATAVAISQHVFPAGPVADAYVANAAESPDAVAGGVLTAGPVLLVPDGRPTPAAVTAELDRVSPRRVVGLGGEIALDDTTLAAAANGRPADRLAGENRYATSVAIGTFQFNGTAPTAYLARGDIFADAVVSGVLTDGPVFLVSSTCGAVPAVVRQALAELDPARVVALGGEGAVCEATLDTAVGAIPDTGEPTVVVAPELEVLTEPELAQVESFDPVTGTIVLGDGTPTVAAIDEGDVIVAGHSEAVPQGFLRRVEQVELVEGGYELTTAEASLPEAVAHTNGPVGGEPVLLASYVEPADGVQVVDGIVPDGQQTPRPEGLAPEAVEIKLEHTLALKKSFDAKAQGANFTGTGSLDLETRVTVGGTLEADADIDWFTLKELRLEAGPTAKATASATITGKLQGKATPALGKITRYWTFPVGPVPVVLTETSDLQLEATITTEGSVGVTAGIEATSRVGFHYRDGTIAPLLNSDGTVTSPQVTGSVTAGVGLDVGPTTEVKAYGVAGLKSTAGPWASATYTSDETTPLSCRLEAGLKASLAAVAGIDILGLKAQMEKGTDFTLTLFDEELCDTDPDEPGDPDPPVDPQPVLPFEGGGEPTAFTMPLSTASTNSWVSPQGVYYIQQGDDAGTMVRRDGSTTVSAMEGSPYSMAEDGLTIQYESWDQNVHARRGEQEIWSSTRMRRPFVSGFGVDYATTHSDIFTFDRDTGELTTLLSEGGTWGRNVGPESRASDTAFALMVNGSSEYVIWFDRQSLTRIGSSGSSSRSRRTAIFADGSAVRAAIGSEATVEFYDQRGQETTQVALEGWSDVHGLDVVPAGEQAFIVEPLTGLRTSRVWVADMDGSVTFLGTFSGKAMAGSENGWLVMRDTWDVPCGPDYPRDACRRGEVSMVNIQGETTVLTDFPSSGPSSVVVNRVDIGFGQVWVTWTHRTDPDAPTQAFLTAVPANVDGDGAEHAYTRGVHR